MLFEKILKTFSLSPFPFFYLLVIVTKDCCLKYKDKGVFVRQVQVALLDLKAIFPFLYLVYFYLIIVAMSRYLVTTRTLHLNFYITR